MLRHNTQYFFALYPFLYTPRNAALLESWPQQQIYLLDLLALLEQKGLARLVSKNNFRALVTLGEELPWLTRICAQLTYHTGQSLLSPPIFETLLTQRPHLESFCTLLSMLRAKKLFIITRENILKNLLDNIEKCALFNTVLEHLPSGQHAPYLHSRDIRSLCLLSGFELEPIGHAMRVTEQTTCSAQVQQACLKQLLSQPHCATLLIEILTRLHDENMLYLLKPSHIHALCQNNTLRYGIITLLQIAQQHDLSSLLTRPLWNALFKNPQRCLDLITMIENILAHAQYHWLNAELFETMALSHQAPGALIHILHELHQLDKNYFISSEDLCFSYKQYNHELVLELIGLIKELNYHDALSATTLPLLMRLQNYRIHYTLVLINTIYHDHLTHAPINALLFTKIMEASKNGPEIINLINFILHNYYSLLTLTNLQHLFENSIHSVQLLTLLGTIANSKYDKIITKENFSTICEFAPHAAEISSILSMIERLQLASSVRPEDLSALSCKNDIVLHNLSEILTQDWQRENRLITPKILQYLLQHYYGPAHYTKALETLMTLPVSVLNAQRLEMLLVNQLPVDPVKDILEMVLRLAIPEGDLTSIINLIFQNAQYASAVMAEVNVIQNQYREIVIHCDILESIVARASECADRIALLSLIKNVLTLPLKLNNGLFQLILTSPIPAAQLFTTLLLLPPSCLSNAVAAEILSLDRQTFESLFFILEKAQENHAECLFSLDVLMAFFNNPDNISIHLVHKAINLRRSPHYSYLDAEYLLKILHNPQQSDPIISLMSSTLFAPGGPWIGPSEFSQLWRMDRKELFFISQMGYQFYHANRELLSQITVMKILQASASHNWVFQALLFQICEKNLFDLLSHARTFDILMLPGSPIPSLLYQLSTEDIDDSILTVDVIESFHDHLRFLPELTPALFALSQAEASLINPTTCAFLMGLDARERILWAQKQAMQASPETLLSKHEPQKDYSALSKLLRLYRSRNVRQRGGAAFLLNNAKNMIAELLRFPKLLSWANNLSSYFLEGCINQPVRGYSEIAAWLFVAGQKTLSDKFDALKYPMILRSIHQKLAHENTMTHVEIEKANALLREVHRSHPEAALWDGVPQNIAYEETLDSWGEREKLSKELYQELTQTTGRSITHFLSEIDFMSTWAPIAFQNDLAAIESRGQKRRQDFFDLMEDAVTNPHFKLSTQHGQIFWPEKPQEEWEKRINTALSLQVEPIVFIKTQYETFLNNQEAAIYNMAWEKTTKLALAFDALQEQKHHQRQQLLEQIRSSAPSLLLSLKEQKKSLSNTAKK